MLHREGPYPVVVLPLELDEPGAVPPMFGQGCAGAVLDDPEDDGAVDDEDDGVVVPVVAALAAA